MAITSTASLSQTLQCNNNQRDASFSSFPNTKEEIIIRKLAESRQDLKKHKGRIHLNHHQYSTREDGDEIGVFGAEKYFDCGIDDDDSPKLATTVANVSRKPKSRLGTPSIRSESSCNSQSALIRGPLIRTVSRKRTNKVQGKSLLASFGCNFCSCSNKESVDVHDELKKPSKDRDPNQILDDHHQDEPKFLKPPEAFGKANSFGLAGVSASSGGGYDEESDASSDLFEIESISGKITSGCLTPTTCYVPSEASVDWSMAAARDFSALSGYGHDQVRPWTSPTRASGGRGATKSRILMGSNSQKAVKVADKSNLICNDNPTRLELN